MTEKTAKFIVQPRTELSEEDLKKYLKEYYNYLKDLFREIREEFEVGDVLVVLEKTASPFQFWLINELICKKINEDNKTNSR